MISKDDIKTLLKNDVVGMHTLIDELNSNPCYVTIQKLTNLTEAFGCLLKIYSDAPEVREV